MTILGVIDLQMEIGGKDSAILIPRGRLGAAWDMYRVAIEGAHYDGTRKLNTAPIDKVPTILQRLRDAGFATDLEPGLADRLRDYTAQQWLDLQAARQRVDLVDAELKKLGESRNEKLGLYRFQRVGVQWLSTKTGALLADDMGLGKTLQALTCLPANVPILVICPANAKGVWRREVAKWRPHLTVELIKGRGNFRWPEPGDVVVVNGDILPDGHRLKVPDEHLDTCPDKTSCEGCAPCRDKLCQGCAPYLKGAPEQLVVLVDEAHQYKNSKAARTRKARALTAVARSKNGRSIALSATPVLNKPQELWSILMLIGTAQETFGSFKNFVAVFNGKAAEYGGYIWGTPDDSIEERLRRTMLRRRKIDVAKDLPRKAYRIIDVEVDKKTLIQCDKTLREMGIEPGENDESFDKRLTDLLLNKTPEFKTWSTTSAALATAKIPALLDLVETYEEAEEPLVVFSAYRAPIDAMSKRPGWAVITGDVSPEERTRIEDKFQRGELKGLAATIDAGGTAITLTYACNVLFVDRKLTPGLNGQAEDRVLRIGQNRPVMVTILVANHRLDERLSEILTAKQELIDATVEAAADVPSDIPLVEPNGCWRHDCYLAVDANGCCEVHGFATDTTEEMLEERVKTSQAGVESAAADRFTREKQIALRRSFQAPSNELERWAANALRLLASADPDGATETNDIGFSKIDTSIGCSLRQKLDKEGGLTSAQWKIAIQICRKYHKQVGKPPEG